MRRSTRRLLTHAAIIALALVVWAALAAHTHATGTTLGGDADCSGTITAGDAQWILQYDVGNVAFLPCPSRADVDKQGGITPVDALLVLQHVAGIIDLTCPDFQPCSE